MYLFVSEAVVQRCSVEKVFLEISTLAQVFSYELCEISKNIFFYRIPLVAASIVPSIIQYGIRYIYIQVWFKCENGLQKKL